MLCYVTLLRHKVPNPDRNVMEDPRQSPLMLSLRLGGIRTKFPEKCQLRRQKPVIGNEFAKVWNKKWPKQLNCVPGFIIDPL